jgi:hypothetical protein
LYNIHVVVVVVVVVKYVEGFGQPIDTLPHRTTATLLYVINWVGYVSAWLLHTATTLVFLDRSP